MNKILQGDVLEVLRTLPDKSVQTCITSPPYFGLRDYGVQGQIGMEETPDAYVQKLVDVFREVKRVLRNDGTLWLNLGDSYSAGGRGGGTEKQDSNRIPRVRLSLGEVAEVLLQRRSDKGKSDKHRRYHSG